MIYLKLARGVGNQLFQLAFGRVMQLEFNDSLTIDDSEGTSYGVVRGLEENIKSPISDFKISNCKFVTHRFSGLVEIKFLIIKVYAFLIRIIPKLINNKDLQLNLECFFSPFMNSFGLFYSQLGYVPMNFKYKGIVKVAYGNFMSTKFWNNHKKTIYKEIKANIKEYNSKYISEIRNNNSVCIHVRKGDYCDSRYKMLDVCDVGYYEKGIQIMKELLDNPVFFVFSNDIKWCTDNLLNLGSKLVFVNENDERSPLCDLFLMSNCKHYILSNSSFSWWGQFLSSNDKRYVIAPRKYVKGKHNNSLANGLVEEDWIFL